MRILSLITLLYLSMTLKPSLTADLVAIAVKTGKFVSAVNTAFQAVKEGLHNVKVTTSYLSQLIHHTFLFRMKNTINKFISTFIGNIHAHFG